jgi:tRNA modification GTPase
MQKDDVIAAIATAPGRAAIGVVRLSGRDLRPYFAPLLGGALEPRRATLTDFLGASGEAIDRGLATFFPGPGSYTGEDVLELHGHGGAAVLTLLLRRCIELGARLADPGEFTLRAFLNERIDLAQAESVADLIDATSEAAARSAIRSLKGEFSAEIERLGEGLLALRTWVEGCIDFPEEDVNPLAERGVRERVAALTEQLEQLRQSAATGNLLRDGARVVLCGRPNVGKSSLLNRLAGEELAIVTEVPGTTRDAVRQTIHLSGVPITLVDTAGLRQSSDPVEQIGIARAWDSVRGADLVLVVIDVQEGVALGAQDLQLLEDLPPDAATLLVGNKIDLINRPPGFIEGECGPLVCVSAKTGAGVGRLQKTILEAIGWRPAEEAPFLARERHLQALESARHHFERAAEQSCRIELFAEELRLAQEALGAVTGEVTSDDLLGEIFSRFCIGK